MTVLARIEAPHFVAGLVVGDGARVVSTAPILAYMRGWTAREVAAYCRRKGWLIERA